MLARPEPFTKQHIILWLAGKPAKEKYPWSNSFRCACGQYWREFADKPVWQPHWTLLPNAHPNLIWLNDLARECITFGELHATAVKDVKKTEAYHRRLARKLKVVNAVER